MEVTAAPRSLFSGAVSPSGSTNSIQSLVSPVIHLQVSDSVQQPFPTPIYVTFTATNPDNKTLCCSFVNETVTPVQWICVANASRIGNTNEYRCALPHNSVWALNSDFYFDSSSPPVPDTPNESSKSFFQTQTIVLGAALVALVVLVFGALYYYMRRRARLNNRVYPYENRRESDAMYDNSSFNNSVTKNKTAPKFLRKKMYSDDALV